MANRSFTFTITLNEPQLSTMRELTRRKNFRWADVVLRKDGAEHSFEADWLREMLQQFAAQDQGEERDPTTQRGCDER